MNVKRLLLPALSPALPTAPALNYASAASYCRSPHSIHWILTGHWHSMMERHATIAMHACRQKSNQGFDDNAAAWLCFVGKKKTAISSVPIIQVGISLD